jgi:hypothetical protein
MGKNVASRELQGVIFKYQGTSYMVMSENQWDSDSLLVKSINPERKVASFPRLLIQESLNGTQTGVRSNRS